MNLSCARRAADKKATSAAVPSDRECIRSPCICLFSLVLADGGCRCESDYGPAAHSRIQRLKLKNDNRHVRPKLLRRECQSHVVTLVVGHTSGDKADGRLYANACGSISATATKSAFDRRHTIAPGASDRRLRRRPRPRRDLPIRHDTRLPQDEEALVVSSSCS